MGIKEHFARKIENKNQMSQPVTIDHHQIREEMKNHSYEIAKNKIGEMDSSKSYPILIEVIADIKAIIPNEAQHTETREIIEESYKLMIQIDELQRLNPLERAKRAAFDIKNLNESFNVLIENIQKIEYTDTNKPLLRELRLWMDGAYWSTVNTKDTFLDRTACFVLTRKTKNQLAEYFQKAANGIACLEERQNALKKQSEEVSQFSFYTSDYIKRDGAFGQPTQSPHCEREHQSDLSFYSKIKASF